MIFNYQDFLFEYQHKDSEMILTELQNYFTIGFEIELEMDRTKFSYFGESKKWGTDLNQLVASRPYRKSLELFKKTFKNFYQKYSDKIEFHYDESLKFGLEIVNQYFTNINDALQYISDFFEEYNKQDFFKFEKSTSLQVNIGTKDKLNWDIVKGLVMLSDYDKEWEPNYTPKVPFVFKDMESRSANLYCKSLKDQIIHNPITPNNEKIYKEILNSTNIDKIKEGLMEIIKKIVKPNYGRGIGFNMSRILYGTDKYVEFRYMGGENITEEIVREKIKYFCYIIYLMTSNYKNKDFIHKLFSFVNKIRSKYEKDLKFNRDLDILMKRH